MIYDQFRFTTQTFVIMKNSLFAYLYIFLPSFDGIFFYSRLNGNAMDRSFFVLGSFSRDESFQIYMITIYFKRLKLTYVTTIHNWTYVKHAYLHHLPFLPLCGWVVGCSLFLFSPLKVKTI